MCMHKLFSAGVTLIGVILVLATSPASAMAPKQNGRIVYLDFDNATSSYNIFSMVADGSDKRIIIHSTPSMDVAQPQVSPDGATILYGISDPTTTPTVEGLNLANVDGTNQRTLISLGANFLNGVAWSPNGSQIIYSILDGNMFEPSVRIVNADGTNDHQVTISGMNPSSTLRSVAWPTADKIAYSLDGQLYTSTPDGTGATSLTGDATWSGATVMTEAWLPDNSKLVFDALNCPGGGMCLVTANGDGTNKQIIQQDTSVTTPCGVPIYQQVRWSPDGAKILFDRRIVCI
jgi:hypothetical protein